MKIDNDIPNYHNLNDEQNELVDIHIEAVEEAKSAVAFEARMYKDEYDQYEPFYCGFAWAKIRPATSKFARALRKAGVVEEVDWNGGYTIWNPSEWRGQSMDFKEHGAEVYIRILNSYGIHGVYMGSRAD